MPQNLLYREGFFVELCTAAPPRNFGALDSSKNGLAQRFYFYVLFTMRHPLCAKKALSKN